MRSSELAKIVYRSLVRLLTLAILGWIVMGSQETPKAIESKRNLFAEADAQQQGIPAVPAPDNTKLAQLLPRSSRREATDVSQTRTLLVGGLERSYVLYVPPSYHREKPIPLVFVFHGRLGTGKLMEHMTGFDAIADRGFIVAYPDGIGRSWNAGHGVGVAEASGVDDVGFIAHLTDTLNREFNIDQHRIYAAGMSNGGIFAYRLACELPGKFAAIASVAGPLAPDIATTCRAAGPISILHIHGTADRIVPWHGGETTSGGRILSVDETIHLWADADKCSGNPAVALEKGDVACQSNRNCEDGTEVMLCRVSGGGHTWPGSEPSRLLEAAVGPTNEDLNASQLIWEFFSRHLLPEAHRRHAREQDLLAPPIDSAVAVSSPVQAQPPTEPALHTIIP